MELTDLGEEALANAVATRMLLHTLVSWVHERDPQRVKRHLKLLGTLREQARLAPPSTEQAVLARVYDLQRQMLEGAIEANQDSDSHGG